MQANPEHHESISPEGEAIPPLSFFGKAKAFFVKTRGLWWRIYGSLLFLVCCTFITVFVQYLSQCNSSSLWFYVKTPRPLYAGVLLVLGLACLFLLLTRSPRWSLALTILLLSPLAIVNAIKCQAIDNPLTPSDLFLFGQGASVFSAEIWPMDLWTTVYSSLSLFGFLVLVFLLMPRCKPQFRYRLPLALLGVLAIGFFIAPTHYPRRCQSLARKSIVPQNQFVRYDHCNGFLVGFVGKTPRLFTPSMEKPKRYGEAMIAQVLKKRAVSPAAPVVASRTPTQEPVNLILVVSESFIDITRHSDLRLSGDPLETFHRLSKENTSFDMVSPCRGGGTCDAEFEILTACKHSWVTPSEHPFMNPLNRWPSLASWLASRDYQTIAIHPGASRFWNRSSAFPALGFDEFVSWEKMDRSLSRDRKMFGISDMSVTKEAINRIEKLESPYFCYCLTIQNHQPFLNPRHAPFPKGESPIKVLHPNNNPKQHQELQNYVDGLTLSDRALAELVNHLRKDERPTLLVFLGDHHPNLTNNMEWLYQNAEDKAIDSHLVPVLVWANFPLRENRVETNLHDLSMLPCYILQQMQMERPLFMQVAENFHQTYPAYTRHVKQDHEGNQVSDEAVLTDPIYMDYRALQYDLFFGCQYALPSVQ